ncbi:hypothetical protein CY658_26835 [Variovorax sp. RO1]|uniref:DUF3304 domain-containing protein n=1 Tax=Variovorax sp. RO1 TaxID=2066034 RepID=UPI000C717BFB|nr:DUF3304 domain-containing protein [Variovorax sp. RO1]PLC02182.1 hypothetical protein CY658_26835 [Variovorax sp. RO1]
MTTQLVGSMDAAIDADLSNQRGLLESQVGNIGKIRVAGLRRNWLFPFVLLASLAIGGCALGHAETVPASVSGVNYTDQDIRYRLFDPKDPKQTVVASEEIGPFAAGGVICCYNVPKTWAPGIQVGVILQSFDNQAKRYRPRQTFIVDLPPYDKSGKAGDVWFINYPDGTVGVLSTAYRPNGDEWPGKIKGWPKPSLAFQMELWERDMKLARQALEADQRAMDEFRKDSKKYLKETWDQFENEPAFRSKLEPFSGPDDPVFFADRKAALEKLVAWDLEKVDRLMKIKP